jgi:aerobic carbon-monoxide dehydrogenase large subunit
VIQLTVGPKSTLAAALPSVINALVDALAEYGIRHIDMPATPERV